MKNKAYQHRNQNKKLQEKSGSAGAGQSRIDEVKGSGVYPASGPLPPGDAAVRGQSEWGQGTRGAVGYQDHGDSEMMSLPPESEESKKG